MTRLVERADGERCQDVEALPVQLVATVRDGGERALAGWQHTICFAFGRLPVAVVMRGAVHSLRLGGMAL